MSLELIVIIIIKLIKKLSRKRMLTNGSLEIVTVNELPNHSLINVHYYGIKDDHFHKHYYL